MPRARKRVNSDQEQHHRQDDPAEVPAHRQQAPVSKRHRPEAVPVAAPQFNTTPGRVLTLGEGDTGQLGLGDEALSRKRPARVDSLPEGGVLQVVAGGMHTACLTADGRVYTFGCNDEQALGRPTGDVDGAEYRPGLVAEGLPDPAEDPVVHLSAGDSHTVATTRAGRVFIWGTFRDSNGVIGLTLAGQVSPRPVPVAFPDQAAGTRIVKSASGASHALCLTSDGRVFSFGCGEQGQLGRVSERLATSRGGRAGLAALLTPHEIRLGRRRHLFDDIWAGAYVSFARAAPSDGGASEVHAWGLNNFYQLGTGDLENKFFPTVAAEFNGKIWREISSGQHHTVALDAAGRVYACGRGEYGRLGRGAARQESSGRLEPVAAGGLGARRCVAVACATACGYSVAEDGAAFAWGMGSNKQLGYGSEDADAPDPGRMEGKHLEGMRVIGISGGGQHAVLLAVEANNNH